MAEPEDAPADEKGGKTLRLLKPSLEKVATTQGEFFTRHIMMGDLKKFNKYLDANLEKDDADLKELGKLALKVLVTTGDSSPFTPALTDNVYDKLSAEDIEKLTRGIAKACDLKPMPKGDAMESLGSVLFDNLSDTARTFAEQAKSMQELIGKNFGSMSSPIQGAIGEHLKQINSISESLRASPAMAAFRKMQETSHGITEKFSALNLTEQARIGPLVEKTRIPAATEFPSLPPIDYANTPMARAATASEEAAGQLREVAGLAAQMADKLANLNTLFLTEVYPKWNSSLQENAKAANKSLRNAVWALVASVVVVLATTGIQLWVGHQHKLENDAQQLKTERVLQQQLEALQSMNRQFSEESPEQNGNPFRLETDKSL